MLSEPAELPRLIEPAAIGCRSDPGALAGFLAGNRRWLEGELRASGALLFRGFGLENEDHFLTLLGSATDEIMSYAGGASPRSPAKGRVYNSTHAPRYAPIPLHCELSYLERLPRRLFLMCKTAPRAGGQTPIGDMASVVDALDPEVVEAFESRGLLFVTSLPARRSLSGQKTWRETFETRDRERAEAVAVEGGYEVEWSRGDVMTLRRRHPALIRHPEHGRRIWFNQVQIFHDSWSWELQRVGSPWRAAILRRIERRQRALPFEECWRQAAFGDGGRIPTGIVEQVRETLWRHARLFDWRPGDVVILDNLWIGHGRLPFSGDRKILLALADPVNADSLYAVPAGAHA